MSSNAENDTQNFVVALYLDVAIGVAVVILFCILRRIKRWKPILEPRMLPFMEQYQHPLGGPHGWLGWIPYTLKVDERSFLVFCGADATVALRWIWFGVQLFSFTLVLCITVLVPVNYFGGYDNPGIGSISLANVATGSSKVAAHFVCTYLVTIVALALLIRLCRRHVHLRMYHLRGVEANLYTLLVKGIPKEKRNEKDISAHFNSIQLADSCKVNIVRKLRNLDRAVAAREKAATQLEHLCAKLSHNESQAARKFDTDICNIAPAARAPHEPYSKADCTRPTKWIHTSGLCFHRVDAIRHQVDLLVEHNAKIQQMLDQKIPPSSKAFVTFHRRASKETIRQTQLSVGGEWRVHNAPEARDLLWDNLYMRFLERCGRTAVVWAISLFLIVFWVLPLSFLSSLTTLDNLLVVLPFLRPVVENNPTVAGIIQGFVPAAAIFLVLNILPMFFYLITSRQGLLCFSRVTRAVLKKQHLWALINIFFVVTISSNVFAVISMSVENPTSVLVLLGETIPSTGTFFCTYIMLQAFVTFPLQLMQLYRLLVVPIGYVFSNTLRERQQAEAPTWYDYGYWMGYHSLNILIGLAYSIVTPLIVPFMVLYLCAAYFVTKMQMLVSYVNIYESGGVLFNAIFSRVCISIIIAQVCVGVALAIKLGPLWSLAFILSPLPVATYLVYRYCDAVYLDRTQHLALEEARHMTIGDEQAQQFNDEYFQLSLFAEPSLHQQEVEVTVGASGTAAEVAKKARFRNAVKKVINARATLRLLPRGLSTSALGSRTGRAQQSQSPSAGSDISNRTPVTGGTETHTVAVSDMATQEASPQQAKADGEDDYGEDRQQDSGAGVVETIAAVLGEEMQ